MGKAQLVKVLGRAVLLAGFFVVVLQVWQGLLKLVFAVVAVAHQARDLLYPLDFLGIGAVQEDRSKLEHLIVLALAVVDLGDVVRRQRTKTRVVLELEEAVEGGLQITRFVGNVRVVIPRGCRVFRISILHLCQVGTGFGVHVAHEIGVSAAEVERQLVFTRQVAWVHVLKPLQGLFVVLAAVVVGGQLVVDLEHPGRLGVLLHKVLEVELGVFVVEVQRANPTVELAGHTQFFVGVVHHSDELFKFEFRSRILLLLEKVDRPVEQAVAVGVRFSLLGSGKHAKQQR